MSPDDKKRSIAAIGLVAIGGIAIMMALQTGGRRHAGESQALKGPVGIVAPSTDLNPPNPPPEFGAYAAPHPGAQDAGSPPSAEGGGDGGEDSAEERWDPSPEECRRIFQLTRWHVFVLPGSPDSGLIDGGPQLTEMKEACTQNLWRGMRLPGVRYAEEPR